MLRRREILFAKRAVVSSGLNPIGTPVTIASNTSGGSTTTSWAITGNTIPAGKTLVLIVVGEDPSNQSVSDDAGLTWSALSLSQAASGPVVNHKVFVCYNTLAVSSGNTITATLSTAKRSNYLLFYVDMGGGTPALDFQFTPTNGGAGDRNQTTGTLATADEFVFVPVVVQSAANSSTVSMTGFTAFVGSTGIGSGSSNPRLHVFWQIVSSTAAITASPRLSDNTKDHEFTTVALKR